MYETLANALVRAKERSGATSQNDAFLTELLQLSAGVRKTDGVMVYRPFYVAAKFLEQDEKRQAIVKADGVEFTGMTTPIASLFALQASMDKALIVPVGFEVPVEFVPAVTKPAAPLRARSISIQSRSRP